MEIMLQIAPNVDFIITRDEYNNYFFKFKDNAKDKTLHLTIALQQWLKEREQEWER